MFGFVSAKEVEKLNEKLSQKDRMIGALEHKNNDLIALNDDYKKKNKDLTEKKQKSTKIER